MILVRKPRNSLAQKSGR